MSNREVIHKYGIWPPNELQSTMELLLPASAVFMHLDVQKQNGCYEHKECLCLWFAVDPDATTYTKRFVLLADGHKIPSHAGTYLGTAVYKHDIVHSIHVFEEGDLW